MTTRRKAATTRLEPGEHSIDRNTPTKRVLKTGEVVVLDWSVRLKDGRLVNKRTQGRTYAGVRRRAKTTAENMLKTSGQSGKWTPTTPIVRYIDEVGFQEIDSAGLRPDSVAQYRRTLKLLRKQLAGHSIASAWQYDVLVAMLNKISEVHGEETARQARTVLGRYVGRPLKRHRLVDGNPLAGERLDLARYAPDRGGKRRRGGRALTAEEQERVLLYLLTLNPAKGVVPPKRGCSTLEDRIAKRRNVIDLTLLQAGTGLRIAEALQITGDLLEVDDSGILHVMVPAEVAKTHQARRVPVADQRIAFHLLARQARQDSANPLIGGAADPSKRWGKTGNGGAIQAIANLYKQMAAILEVPLMEDHRSHLWRTTLGARYAEAGVPREQFAAVLGHDEATNAKSYTDRTDTTGMVTAYNKTHHPKSYGQNYGLG